MSIYQLNYWISEPRDFLSKDSEIISLNERINATITEEVFNPSLTLDGLRRRRDVISAVSYSMLFYGGIMLVVASFLMLLSVSWLIVNAIYCISHYCIGTGVYIALFRAWRASIDEIIFNKHGKSKDFKIDPKANVRGYDFLITLPFALFPLVYF